MTVTAETAPPAVELRHISERALQLEPLLNETEDPSCGALALFAGSVRNHHLGQAVTHLIYSAHPQLCERIIAEVEAETRDRFGVPHCRIVHRIGSLAIGEVAIYAVVRAPHRAEAFAALRHAVDATKHRAPIWKEEFLADGSSQFVAGCCMVEDPQLRLDPAPR